MGQKALPVQKHKAIQTQAAGLVLFYMAVSVLTSHVFGPAELFCDVGGVSLAKITIRTDPFAMRTDPFAEHLCQ